MTTSSPASVGIFQPTRKEWALFVEIPGAIRLGEAFGRATGLRRGTGGPNALPKRMTHEPQYTAFDFAPYPRTRMRRILDAILTWLGVWG